MKPFMKTAVVPALVLMFLAACGTGQVNKENNSAGSVSQTSPTQSAAAAVPGVQLKDDKLNAVYEHYVRLTAALVKGDAKEARIAGNAIATGAREIPGGEAIGLNASKIIVTADLEAQRTAFSALSNDFISLAKKSGLNNGQLYVDFCPMAMNDKGAYWISDDSSIRNPYFGEKMMTCGEVKETIQ